MTGKNYTGQIYNNILGENDSFGKVFMCLNINLKTNSRIYHIHVSSIGIIDDK